MKFVEYPNEARYAVSMKKTDYRAFLELLLKHTDIVCFTVTPYLDDLSELKEDARYQNMLDSYLDSEFVKSIHTENISESLIYFKADYPVREFLKTRKNLFDFYDEDAPINLEDIVFIGNDRILCDTITHETYCAVSEDLRDSWNQSRSGKNAPL